MEYDIVGDVHGNADALETLLSKMGYRFRSDRWTPPAGRALIFVGDLIDRGDRQLDTLNIARRMIDSGHASGIIGNHELNARAWFHGHRADTPKNRGQHARFLDSVGERGERHKELISWFQSLPLWLELPELRVVHACWDGWALNVMSREATGAHLDVDLLQRATSGGSNSLKADGTRPPCDPVFSAVETLTKGIEVDLPDGVSYLDKDGNERRNVRVKWWLQGATFAEAAFLPKGLLEALPPDALRAMHEPLPTETTPGYDNIKPLFLGHYWRTGAPELLTPHIACVDYSAGRGGPLVAYQWRGEKQLLPEHFTSSR